jgi:hypothetical protein
MALIEIRNFYEGESVNTLVDYLLPILSFLAAGFSAWTAYSANQISRRSLVIVEQSFLLQKISRDADVRPYLTASINHKFLEITSVENLAVNVELRKDDDLVKPVGGQPRLFNKGERLQYIVSQGEYSLTYNDKDGNMITRKVVYLNQDVELY